MTLIEYIYNIDVPEAAYSHPAVIALSEAGNDIISWANVCTHPPPYVQRLTSLQDIYSFNNEQARGVSPEALLLRLINHTRLRTAITW